MTVCRKRGASGQEEIQYIKYLLPRILQEFGNKNPCFSRAEATKRGGGGGGSEPIFLGRGCDEALFSEEKKGLFSEKGGGNSANPGFGNRKGNSVKRFGPFTELPDSED